MHGDVKPGNVLCGAAGGGATARLLDYHLAITTPAETDALQRGTLRYMAPEVVSGAAPGPRSDLYVKIDLDVPKKLTKAQKQLIKDLQESGL